MIFGGTITLRDGSKVDLIDAFDLAFEEWHVLRACEKCGYIPSWQTESEF